MAIKSKNKGRARGKKPARAPRHEPVPVKPPFARRTWVRLTAAFIAGVFLLSMCWWVWENLDKDRNQKAAASTQAQQQEAIAVWRGALEPVMSQLSPSQTGLGPQVAPSLAPAIAAIAKGQDPKVSASDMTAIATELDGAADTLEKFEVGDKIADHGFDRGQVDSITSAHAEIIAGLRSLAVAARLAALAIKTPALHKELAAEAQEASDTGQELIARGWTKYTNALVGAGMQPTVPQGLG